MTLVLASRSPRRADILARLGMSFVIDAADIDESPRADETPREMVLRLAAEKCREVAARHPADAVVLAADTTVDVDGEVFGTPRDIDHARIMLQRLSGRTHLVHTAVSVSHGGLCQTLVDTARVTMGPIDSELLERYLATGESLDKAGAYAVQGGAAIFVEQVEGHTSTVVGLPVRLVERLLAPLGLLPASPHP